MDRPAAIVFDAYGTLLDVRSVAVACEQRWPGAGERLSAFWRAKQLEYTWLRSLMGDYADFWAVTAAALDYACAALGLESDPLERVKICERYLSLQPFPEVPAALERLGGRPLLVLSNGTEAMLQAGLRYAGLRAHFAAVLSVDVLKIFKPAPQVYALATAHLGLPPAELLFVSANGWDIAGAAHCGLRTCWLNRAGAPLERLGAQPELIVQGLDQLAELI